MKIYSPHPKAHKRNSKRFTPTTQTLYFTPGIKNPETSMFMTTDAKTNQRVPKQFCVTFINGEAEVDDQLGKWLVDNGHVLKSKRLIKLPGEDD